MPLRPYLRMSMNVFIPSTPLSCIFSGNCWFVAGAAVLATSHPHLLARVVPSDQGFEQERYTGQSIGILVVHTLTVEWGEDRVRERESEF